VQPTDLCPIFHCDHSLTLPRGVKIRSASGGQLSPSIDEPGIGKCSLGREVADGGFGQGGCYAMVGGSSGFVAGIDATVTAKHRISMRTLPQDGAEGPTRFAVEPSLAGMDKLTERLRRAGAPWPRSLSRRP
jgi:hypothetical protein